MRYVERMTLHTMIFDFAATECYEENEAVKIIRFKQALSRLSEAYVTMGRSSSVDTFKQCGVELNH